MHDLLGKEKVVSVWFYMYCNASPFLGSEKKHILYLDMKCSLCFCLDNDKAFRLYFLDFQVNSFLLFRHLQFAGICKTEPNKLSSQ